MAIQPPIKTKVTIDPDTGAKVFNQSWSSSIKKTQGIKRKPVSRETFVTEKKQVPKKTVLNQAKERTFSEVVRPSIAKNKISEIKAGDDFKKVPSKTNTEIRKKVFEVKTKLENENLLKNNPGKTIEEINRERYKRIEKTNTKENQPSYEPASMRNKKVRKCTNC